MISKAQNLVRFGDNMRFVAVTDGDKVEAETQSGFSVNTLGSWWFGGIVNDIGDGEVKTFNWKNMKHL